ncbi:MAG TPA: response regulator [Bryobacteraceae bacterium]|nr:response regulator [Bryobacteraceae bacterium]
MTRPVHILLVEDNPGDVRLTIEALKESQFPSNLHVVRDGVEALDYLRNVALPDLILLDLNLPRRSGREVLTEIKADPALRRIPVMVLSTSRSDADVQFSYDHHANCYIQKPMELDRFFDVVRSIEQFWCSVASLPATS